MFEHDSLNDLIYKWNCYCTHTGNTMYIYDFEMLRKMSIQCRLPVVIRSLSDYEHHPLSEMFYTYNKEIKMYIPHTSDSLSYVIDIGKLEKWYLNKCFGVC